MKIKQPTLEQINRFAELEQRAISYYLDKTDFDASEWLTKEDSEEYMKLIELINY